MQVLSNKIENLGVDIAEMRQSVVKMTDALIKFAVVEERQTQAIAAQDRIALTIDRVSARQEAHEKMCTAQDKELRILIADSTERLSGRVAELEKAEPIQEQTGKWVMGAVWGAAALLAAVVAKQLGLM